MDILEYWREVERSLISPDPNKLLQKLGWKWKEHDPSIFSKELGVGYGFNQVMEQMRQDSDEFFICGTCGENIMDCDGMHLLERKYEA